MLRFTWDGRRDSDPEKGGRGEQGEKGYYRARLQITRGNGKSVVGPFLDFKQFSRNHSQPALSSIEPIF